MAPPPVGGQSDNKDSSEIRRPSRLPRRFSPGPTKKRASVQSSRSTRSVPPPPPSQAALLRDDLASRFSDAPLLLSNLPEADFELPEGVNRSPPPPERRRFGQPPTKMPPKRGKSKPPVERPTRAKSRARKESKVAETKFEPKPRGARKSGFSTPKLPAQTVQDEEEVVYSPAAKRQRTMPAKYRENEASPAQRKGQNEASPATRKTPAISSRSTSRAPGRPPKSRMSNPEVVPKKEIVGNDSHADQILPEPSSRKRGRRSFEAPNSQVVLESAVNPAKPFQPAPATPTPKKGQKPASQVSSVEADGPIEDESAFIEGIASDPLPFELETSPKSAKITSRAKTPARKAATKVPPVKEVRKSIPGPSKLMSPKKELLTPKREASVATARTPGRKAATNISPKKATPRKTPLKASKEAQESEKPQEPKEEVPVAPVSESPQEPPKESAAEAKPAEKKTETEQEPSKVETPKIRKKPGPKPKPKNLPVTSQATEAPAKAAETLKTQEETPAVSNSGRPQRHRKIPSKLEDSILLDNAVLNSAAPDLQRMGRGRSVRRSFSIAPDVEARKSKRFSISEVDLASSSSTPVGRKAGKPKLEPALLLEAPPPASEPVKEETKPETEVKGPEEPKPAMEKPEANVDAPAKEAPKNEPSKEEAKDALTKAPQALEAPKPNELLPEASKAVPALVEASAPLPGPSTPASISQPSASNVRSSGRVRKKPQDRDFYPGHHYARPDARRSSFHKSSESDDYDIDPTLMAELFSHTDKLAQTLYSPRKEPAEDEAPEALQEASKPVVTPAPKAVKRKRTESEISTYSDAGTPVPKPRKAPKKAAEGVFKTPLPPKPKAAPRKSSSFDIPIEVMAEPPATPSTPMNFPMLLSAPQLEVNNYNQPIEFFDVASWNNQDYKDYLEYIEERQKANFQSVGLGFLRETLPATEDYFYREVLRSGGDLERVESSPVKRGSVDRLEVDVTTTDDVQEKDLIIADPAEKIAKDIVDYLQRPLKIPSIPEGDCQELDEGDLIWNLDDARALAQKHNNPRFAVLLLDIINVITAQFVCFVSSFGRDGGPAIYYSHAVHNGRKLSNLLHRCIGDEKDFPNAIHEWMIRNLPLEALARYLDLVRFLAESNKQNDLIVQMMSIGTDVIMNSCHNWVLEFTLAQTSDPHTDLVKHSLKTVQLHEAVFVIVHPNIPRAGAVPFSTSKAHVPMFRDLLPGIADHVDVKLNYPDDLRTKYEILNYLTDTVTQEIDDTLQRFPNHHVVVAAWGVSCRIVQRALQDASGVSAALMFAYPNDSILADPDDEANLTYCPTLFVGGENTTPNYIEELQTTRKYMIANTGLVVVANADQNLLVSAVRLGIERLSQRTVDRAIVEHVYDFLKLVVKQAAPNLKQHRKDMTPLDMAALLESSNTTIEDHKIKKTLFQSPSTARSSASRHNK